MKKKSVFLFVLFFLIFSPFLFTSETDFYGTWQGDVSVYNEGYFFKIDISKTIFSIEIVYIYYDFAESLGVFSADIKSWTEVENTDTDTLVYFPDGFLLEMLEPGGETDIMDVFISKDKTLITFPVLNEDYGEPIIFSKY